MIVQWKIKEFSKYLFDFNSKNYKDEKQIKEHAQNLKVFYNKPIEQIENVLKSKAASKVVCASAEPAFFCTYKNGEQMISYTVIKRYKPTETPENKYGRYLAKFVVQNNMVQEYEIIKEVLEPCRLFDTSNIPMRLDNGELDEKHMPMDISEVGELKRRDMRELIEDFSSEYRGKNIEQTEFQKIDNLVRDFYLVMGQGNYRLYTDDIQKEYMIERIKQFGYSQEWAQEYINGFINNKKYTIRSQGLTAPEYVFHSTEDSDIVVAYVYNMLYMAYADGLATRYAIMVDEMQLRKKDDATYGYVVESVTKRLNQL